MAHVLKLLTENQYTQEKVENIYRDIHSLKGAAFLYSFNEIGVLAHKMESQLEAVRDEVRAPTKIEIDAFYIYLHRIEKHLKEIFSDNENGNENPEKGKLAQEVPQAVINKEKMSSELIPKIEKMELDKIQPQQQVKSKEKEAEGNSTIRVAVSLLDNLMTLMGEMVLVRNQVLQFSSQSEDLEFLNLSKRLNVVTSEIQGEMMKTRMQPIGNILNKYNRVVHDLSSELHKEIHLSLFGSETELDKSLLESIKDPLTHIVRNSCDHGIETPDVRLKSGKNKFGTIAIKAYHEGGQVVIEVSDDGKGLHKENLIKKGLERGIITSAQVPNLSEKEILNLIFAPGFSTAESVTSVSGRGVGMDVVRTNVERIGGSVELESVAGKGTTTKLKIPLTLAIVPALIIKCSGETFAIPQIKLEELVRVDPSSHENKIELLHGVPVYRLRGRILPLVSLNNVLKLNSDKEKNQAYNIAVLNADHCSFGLIVDEILDTADIVVKPINRLLKSLQVYSGATILGDGSIALILDIVGMSKTVQLANDKDAGHSSEVNSKNQLQNIHRDFQEFLIVRLNSPTMHALALNDVYRLEEFPITRVEVTNKMRVIRYGQSLLPIISINSLMGYGNENLEKNEKVRRKETLSVVVVEKAGLLYGLEVDEIIDTISTDIVVETNLALQKGTFGNLSMPDQVIIVLNAFEIINLSFPETTVKPVFNSGYSSLVSAKGKNLQILLVEDTVFFRRELSKILKSDGHEISIANDGMEALQILESNPTKFDLIVTDIEMPRMNGFELAKSVRGNKALSAIPMLAISSKADKNYTDKGLKAGFDIYIEKLKPETLLKAVATLSLPRKVA
ncbi:MAG: chemotaxis protein CheW [Bdellovibrionales bacterium]|nr:chemotaxis protein CheW [Bdellovibrionales bacterium]